VFVGAFSDMIFYFLADNTKMTATLIEDGQYRISLKRWSDIGYVLAKALTNPNYAKGGYLSTCGTTQTWKEALEMVEKAVGKSFEYNNLTAKEALQQENALLAKGDMESFVGSLTMTFLENPARGRSGFDVSKKRVMWDMRWSLSKLLCKLMYTKQVDQD
jgi:nucleoside-diphosphate-sugar epimerase